MARAAAGYLKRHLRNGDVVDIVTSPNQQPSKDWLDFVGTMRARSKIRNHLRQEQRDKSKRLGEELLEKELHAAGISATKLLKNDVEMRRVFETLKVQNLEELFIGIGYGKIDPQDVLAIVAPPEADGKETKAAGEIRESRIAGLEIGADDYVAKPFEARELSLRIANILRRTQPAAVSPPAESVRFGPFLFHIARGELRRGEELIHLTDREKDMLRLLAARPGETVPRLMLAGKVTS